MSTETTNRTELPLCPNGHPVGYRMWGECPKCQGIANRHRAERLEDETRRMKLAIASGNANDERASMKQLFELGHPDVSGLIASVKAKLEGPKAKRSRRADL